MIKPYVIIMDTRDHTRRYCLDRAYNWMRDVDDKLIDACTMGDVVQLTVGVAASFTYPAWVDLERQVEYISLWFNYYDGEDDD